MQHLFRRVVVLSLIVTGLFLMFEYTGYAQDDKLKDFTFEDVPTEDAKPPYFAIALGFTPTVSFANLTEINMLTQNLTGSTYNSPMVLLGVQAFAAIGLIPNVRVGFTSLTGTSSRDNTVSGVTRRAEYTVNMNSINIEYAWTIAKGLAIVPGIAGGWGSLNYEASQNSSSNTFVSFPFGASAGQANSMRRMRSNMILAQGNLNVEYAFTSVSMIRLNVGYTQAFMGEWQVDNSAPLSGVPSTISASGLTAQVGLFFGLFNN